jgi:hypothetical protein
MPIHLSCPKSQGILMGALLAPDTLRLTMEHLRESEHAQEVQFREQNTQQFKETYGSLSLTSLWEIVLRDCEMTRRLRSYRWWNLGYPLDIHIAYAPQIQIPRVHQNPPWILRNLWSTTTATPPRTRTTPHSGLSAKDTRRETRRLARMTRVYNLQKIPRVKE